MRDFNLSAAFRYASIPADATAAVAAGLASVPFEHPFNLAVIGLGLVSTFATFQAFASGLEDPLPDDEAPICPHCEP